MILYYILKLITAAAYAQSCGPQDNGSYVLCAQLPGQPAVVSGPAEYISIFFKYGMGLVGLLGFAVIVWSGFNYIIQRGNYAKLADIKDHIYQAVFGIVLLFASVLILNELDPSFTQIKDIQLKEIPRAQIAADLDAARRKQLENAIATSKFVNSEINKIKAGFAGSPKDQATAKIQSTSLFNDILNNSNLTQDQKDNNAKNYFQSLDDRSLLATFDGLGGNALNELIFITAANESGRPIADKIDAGHLISTYDHLGDFKEKQLVAGANTGNAFLDHELNKHPELVASIATIVAGSSLVVEGDAVKYQMLLLSYVTLQQAGELFGDKINFAVDPSTFLVSTQTSQQDIQSRKDAGVTNKALAIFSQMTPQTASAVEQELNKEATATNNRTIKARYEAFLITKNWVSKYGSK